LRIEGTARAGQPEVRACDRVTAAAISRARAIVRRGGAAGGGRLRRAARRRRRRAGAGVSVPSGPGRLGRASAFRRRHRDLHRPGQAVPGLGDGHGLAADSGVRARREPRRGAGLPRAGRGRGGARRAGARVIMHTDQDSEYTAGLVRRACARLGIFQSMAGRARRWTTRSSSPGTPPWSSNSAARGLRDRGCGPGPGQRLDRGLQLQAALRAGHDVPGSIMSAHCRPGRQPEMLAPPRRPACSGARPYQGRSSLDRGLRPAEHGSNREAQTGKISQFEVSTLSGEPRKQ
jgi:hypothetical protein